MPSKYANEDLVIEVPETKESMIMETQETLGKIDDIIANTGAQIEKEYNKYIDLKNKGKFEEAKRALKIFLFMSKMQRLATKFKELLERVENIQRLFDILQDTNKIFTDLMSIDNAVMMRSMKKNLKLFRKKISKYESDMNQMFDLIDRAFDDRPNPIVAFFNKLFGKKGPNASDDLAAFEAQAQTYINDYRSGTGTDSGAAGTATVTGSPAAPAGTDSGDIMIL